MPKTPLRRGLDSATLTLCGLLAFLVPALVFAQGLSAPNAPPADEPQNTDAPHLFSTFAVEVTRFEFTGNTAFTDAQLADVLTAYVGRALTSEDLEDARRELTLHYINAGYVNSGAVLDDQPIIDGVITFRLVEGQLSDIHVRGNNWLRDGYITSRVRLGAKTPLNVAKLKNQLQMLRDDPNVKRLNAELHPGAAPGDSYLDLEIHEANPFHLGLRFDNHRSPSIGAERFSLFASDTNLTGNGDTLALDYGITKNGLEEIELAGLDIIDVSYSLPVTAHDTTLTLSFSRNDTLVIEEPFLSTGIDISSETFEYSLGLRHPLYRDPSTEFALSLGAEHRENTVFISGQPSAILPGSDRGESNVTVLSFGQHFLLRQQNRAFAAISMFRFGIDAWDATTAGSADGEFTSWLGQFQFVQRLWDSNNQLILRATTQITDSPLLSLERFSLGGVNTVRGYRQNQMVRDEGVIFSIETRLPILFDNSGKSILSLAPFFDAGLGWNANDDIINSTNIISAGLGLLINPCENFNAQIYWGHAFRDFDDNEEDAQDAGLHFSVSIIAF